MKDLQRGNEVINGEVQGHAVICTGGGCLFLALNTVFYFRVLI